MAHSTEYEHLEYYANRGFEIYHVCVDALLSWECTNVNM